MIRKIVTGACVLVLLTSCWIRDSRDSEETKKLKIIIDTDANNELDDQHALAYAFLNLDVFDVLGITVNNTYSGNGIQGQFDEAERVIKLFNLENKMPLLKGAEKGYNEISSNIEESDFDGHAAVDFIINQAMETKRGKLVVVALGKLTNIALALLKEPKIIDKIRVVWLGSNYPSSGEYNLQNDTASVNPVMESGVTFEMFTVRYGEATGTAAVDVTLAEIREKMRGKGPISEKPITGRDGGTFSCFGDYSVSLFENIGLEDESSTRPLFDMVVLAVLKNKNWGKKQEVDMPKLVRDAWEKRTNVSQKIIIWEKFDRDSIVNDLFNQMHGMSPKN